MARKPNYDFERKERQRLKAAKTAARAEEKLKPADSEEVTVLHTKTEKSE